MTHNDARDASRGYKSFVSKVVPMARAKVFAGLLDFGGVRKLLPEFLASCSCEGVGVGAVRTVQFVAGGWARERCDLAYGQSVFVYSLIENAAPNLLPFTAYVSVVTLCDVAGGGTLVEWGSNWTATRQGVEDDVRAMCEGLYTTLLAKMVERA
jgi:Polyketide cyclase / dehydrase and lipid transport